MLRQIAIILLVPILVIPGLIPDDISFCPSSLNAAQYTSDNSPDPDRSIADADWVTIVQITLVISFLISSSYFIPRQELPVLSTGSRAPPFSR
jgi:hypothetical protein